MTVGVIVVAGAGAVVVGVLDVGCGPLAPRSNKPSYIPGRK
jgi:hypothetical protein